MIHFNLLDEPWIPVIRQKGALDELSLTEVLRQAHELREIRDPLPIVEFGLYRLLVALVMDIFDLKSPGNLETLLDTGHFEPEKLNFYFKRWRDRFDLFHPRYPFLQTAGMDDEKPKPLAGLIPSVASGTNASHFYHTHEDLFCVCPAAAARLLTTIAPFMTAGGAGLSPSINGAPPWYVLIQRENLFQTLCLNCYALPLSTTRNNHPPAWRNEEVVTAGRRKGASLLESFTWQPRRIQLLPSTEGAQCALTGKESPVMVCRMKFTAGASCDFEWVDPNVPYRITKDKRVPLRVQEDHALWRDSGALALLNREAYTSDEGSVRFDRPLVVEQFCKLVETRILPQDTDFSLTAYGMRTDMKMKVFEWRRETLALPVPLVLNRRFAVEAQKAIDKAGRIAYHLQKAIKRVYPREGKSNDSAMDSVITVAKLGYWERLRLPYDRLLHRLAELPADGYEQPLNDLELTWAAEIRTAARKELHMAVKDMDTDHKRLKRQAEALQYLDRQLFFLLETGEQKKERKTKKTQQMALSETWGGDE